MFILAAEVAIRFSARIRRSKRAHLVRQADRQRQRRAEEIQLAASFNTTYACLYLAPCTGVSSATLTLFI